MNNCEQRKLPLFGRYQLLSELGRGGMGIVYKAYDRKVKSVIALKIMLHQERKHIERFFLETITIAKLNHPNIVRFYECGDKPKPYFTMEYIEGVTLKHLIKERNINPQQLVNLMIPLCDALYYAHSNRVQHRDIKPDNIMITNDGVPKIMDFGLAKVSDMTKQISKSGEMLGTLHYMAPEQIEGKGTYQSDLYSFGASLYEALTFRTVYQGLLEINVLYQIANSTPIPLRQLNPDISPYLEAICLKCLKRYPQKRYSNFKQLADELQNFKMHKRIIAKRYTSWDMLINFMSKHKVMCTSIIIIFGILMCSLVVTINAFNYAEQEHIKTKKALNKVMHLLDDSLVKYEVLRKDKEFSALFTQIFKDVEQYGEDKDWSFIKGYATQSGKNIDKSIEYYTTEIKNNAQNADAYNNRGNLYSKLNKYKLALEDYNKAVDLSPFNSHTYTNRGNLYSKLKEYDLAFANYNKSIKLNPRYVNGYKNRGSLYSKLKKYGLALADYNRAITIDAKDANAYSRRGNLYFKFKRYRLARLDLEKAIELNPKDLNLYINRGNLYKNLKEYKLALKDYNKGIIMSPEDSRCYVNRGNLYKELKEYKLALIDYAKAVKLSPRNVGGYMNRGDLYKELQEYKLALEDYHNVINIAPQYPHIFNTRANIYKILGEAKLALLDYNKAIELNPLYPGTYCNRGNLYQKLKKYNLALLDLNKAIKIDPSYFGSYNNRGLIYLDMKNYTKALDDFLKTLASAPDIWQVHYNLFRCYKALNHHNKAQDHFLKMQQLKRK